LTAQHNEPLTSPDEFFGPPIRSDTEGGLRLVRTSPDTSTLATLSLNSTLYRSVTSPATITTDKQDHLEDGRTGAASLQEKPIDRYTLPMFRFLLYFLISFKVAIYTLLTLYFNDLLPVVGYPLNIGYVIYATIWIFYVIFALVRRISVILRKDVQS